MGRHIIRRRIVATAAGGSAIALLALLSVPQAVSAQPLVGAAGLASGGYGAAYLEIDGVTPTSSATSVDHSRDIALHSMSWKVSNSSSSGISGGAGAGKATVDTFTVVKSLDGATPQLLGATATAKRIANAHIFLVRLQKPGGAQLEALQYDLKNVVVVDDENSTDGGGTETLKLDAAQITITYSSGTTPGTSVNIDRIAPN